MDKIGGDELGQERRYDVGEQHDAFREVADEVLGGGQDDDVEYIVNETWTSRTRVSRKRLKSRGRWIDGRLVTE